MGYYDNIAPGEDNSVSEKSKDSEGELITFNVTEAFTETTEPTFDPIDSHIIGLDIDHWS